MFGIIKAGSRRRREAAVAREKSCIAAGCKCYCHRPTKDLTMGQVLLILIVFGVFWTGMMMLLLGHFAGKP